MLFGDVTTCIFINGHQHIKECAASICLKMQVPGYSANQTTWCHIQESIYLKQLLLQESHISCRLITLCLPVTHALQTSHIT